MPLLLDNFSRTVMILLQFSLLLTVGLFFLAENGRINAFATYLVAILLLVLATIGRVALRDVKDSVLAAAAGLLLYLTLSAGVDDGWDGVVKHLGYALLIFGFMLGMLISETNRPGFFQIFALLTIACATASAAISLYLHFLLPDYQPLPEPRLYGLGRLGNPVISAVSWGFAIVLAVHAIVTIRVTWQQVLLVLAIPVIAWAIALTGTRVSWLAMGLAIATGLSLQAGRREPWLFTAIIAVVGAAAFLAVGWEDLTKRALSFRPEIWQEFIGRTLAANPLLGVGSGADSKWVTEILTFKHAHSVFVSTFYYGGIVGLGLLVTLLITCGVRLARTEDSTSRQLAIMTFVYGVTVALFDGDNILTKVDYLWWVMWFPVAVIASLRPTRG